MAHLPTEGEINWGATLNDFLLVSHREDGKLKNHRSVINAQDYGAAGDGTTDDTAVLQQAIDAAASGGMLLIPAGIYSTRKLLLPSKITICGDGNNTTLILRDGTLDTMFTNQDWEHGNNQIVLRDLRLVGNRTNNAQIGPNPAPNNSTEKDKSHGINFRYVEDSLIENLTIVDFYFDGIYLGTSVPDKSDGGEGDRSSGSNRNIVRNNRVIANGRNGISITRGTDNTVLGNFFQQNNIGVKDAVPDPFLAGAITIEPNGAWYDVSRNTICNNHLVDNYYNGIQVLKNWTSTGILLASNTISGTAHHGIAAALVSGLIIQGNHVSTSAYVGMALGLGTGIKDAVISANVVCQNGGTGILINGEQGERIVVSANVVVGNATSQPYSQGIGWVDAKQVTVIGNICLENSSPVQILAGGADPVLFANRTAALNVAAENRVLRGDELFASGWQLRGDSSNLFAKNQQTGKEYKLPLEVLASS